MYVWETGIPDLAFRLNFLVELTFWLMGVWVLQAACGQLWTNSVGLIHLNHVLSERQTILVS